MYDFTGDSTRQLTDFRAGEQIFTPRFSDDGNSIVFDMNTKFGLDIYRYSLNDQELSLLIDYRWDVRSPVLHGNTLTFADDRTGIFNIYRRDLSAGEEWPVTNVPGGAFMPDIAEDGTLALALFNNGGYRFGLYRNVERVDADNMIYKDFEEQVPTPEYDDSQFLTIDKSDYTSEYSEMFIVPRLMIEYGTVKPGVYFFSNEILEQMSVMGSASINRLRDIDIFLLFEYNQLRPTLYADIAFLTRNISEKIYFYEGQTDPGDPQTNADLRFSLMQTNFGIRQQWYRFPWGTFKWDLYGRYEQYSTFIKYLLSQQQLQSLPGNFLSKLRYEYFVGKQVHFDIDWSLLDFRSSRLSYINRGAHLNTKFTYSYERNDFIDDFRISESGLLEEVYTPNYYHKIENTLSAGMSLPFWEKSSISADVRTGWISKDDVDDFFYFFAGGMPGLKGYPFYSISGSRMWTNTFQWLAPVATGVNWRLIPFNFQDIYLGPYFQVGDAWKGGFENIRWRKSAGVELRLGGFSFYAYPTAISLDAAYGFDSFKLNQSDTQGYGNEWRYYFKLLFEFDT
ncbi:MAG: Protein TolB [Candidatus Marinimicrobia bacterium]|nr:Protein TolB [Candidatus Neomarinimicrobiota bacterium]